jgi:hypothetical protein
MKTMFASETRSGFIFPELNMLMIKAGFLAGKARPNGRSSREAMGLRYLFHDLPPIEHAKARWGMGDYQRQWRHGGGLNPESFRG